MRSLVQCAFSSGCDDCVAVPSSFEWDSILIVARLPHPRNLKFKSLFAFQIFVVYTGTNYTEDACSGKKKSMATNAGKHQPQHQHLYLKTGPAQVCTETERIPGGLGVQGRPVLG